MTSSVDSQAGSVSERNPTVGMASTAASNTSLPYACTNAFRSGASQAS